MHGSGIYTWPDGRRYEGDYAFDRKHGEGVYVKRDGTKYSGLWNAGKQHGKGVEVERSGVRKVGPRIFHLELLMLLERHLGEWCVHQLDQQATRPTVREGGPSHRKKLNAKSKLEAVKEN